MKPILGLTMGDPAGVGPELCLRAAHAYREAEFDLHLYGNRAIFEKVGRALQLPTTELAIRDTPIPEWQSIAPGVLQARCGQAAYDALTSAVDDALAGTIAGVVTAPLNKAALELAGHSYPGHTEILVERTGAVQHAMMLSGSELSCTLVTTHIGLGEVPGALTTARIVEVGELTAQLMERRHRRPARLAVLGLNPHAGEGGLFGQQEEERIIEPAIVALRASGHEVRGPLPPDTAFLPQVRREVDAYLCMYHDQGLIPLKTLCFEEGVNVTLGLPIIRTSVDHGTAFDIAWQGTASPTSLYAAIDFATSLLD